MTALLGLVVHWVSKGLTREVTAQECIEKADAFITDKQRLDGNSLMQVDFERRDYLAINLLLQKLQVHSRSDLEDPIKSRCWRDNKTEKLIKICTLMESLGGLKI